MSYWNWSEFWWENITGPNYILTSITECLLNNVNVVFIVPSDLPWRYEMRHILEDRVKERSGSYELLVDYIDAEDEYPADEKVGIFLLKKCAQSPDVQNGFRDRGKSSIQDYLKKNEVLRNRIIWVKGLTGAAAKDWMEFCKNYSSEGINTGLFVLEVHNVGKVVESSNLKSISYEGNISANDIQVFNEFILNEEHGSDELWNNYIAAVTACLCDQDAEISELLIRTNNFKSEPPECGLQRIAGMPEYQRRGGDEHSSHILALVRNNDENEINRRIWVAQVKILFPIIEMERNAIIQKYKTNIEYALQYNDIEQYNEKLVYPEDVELGTLIYMMHNNAPNSEYKMLYISEQEVKDRIHFLRECRNTIAHAKICNPQQVHELIASHNSFMK